MANCITQEPICRKRHDTFPLNYVLESVVGVTPINITGFTFLLTVDPSRVPTSSATNLFQVAGVIDDAANGKFSFTLTDAKANQTAGVYHYDVQMIDAGGKRRTLHEGTWTVEQDITKD